MKRILIMAFAVGLVTAGIDARAQSRVVPAQSPSIVASGTFNNGLGTTQRTFSNNVLPLYTKLDTVSGTAGVDSFKFTLVGEYNSVEVQVNVTKIAGRIDSFAMIQWASLDGVNYFQIATTTATNSAGTKAYSFLYNSGVCWPYAYGMITAACTNAATGSSGSWKGFLLPR